MEFIPEEDPSTIALRKAVKDASEMFKKTLQLLGIKDGVFNICYLDPTSQNLEATTVLIFSDNSPAGFGVIRDAAMYGNHSLFETVYDQEAKAKETGGSDSV